MTVWVNVEERLPEVLEDVLIKIEFNNSVNIESGWYKGDGLWVGCWYTTYNKPDSVYKVTAWAPIPQ